MSTPTEPLYPTDVSHTAFTAQPSATAAINPDDPPWGIGGAVLVWVGSVIALSMVPVIALCFYLLYRNIPLTAGNISKTLLSDPQAVFLSIAVVFPTHLLMLGWMWALVTRFGKQSFWETVGWSWSPRFGFWACVSLTLALLVVAYLLAYFFGGDKTQIDQIIASSNAARFTVAFLVTATAPLVEELIYRGVLYSALQRAIGIVWAVVGVTALFTIVHVAQYANNYTVIGVVGILSLTLTMVRALTGRLLPCFIMHLVFNGIQAAVIITEPLFRNFNPGG